VRIASFNVENLFSRARAMNLANWAEGKPILEQYTRMNKLIQKAVYTAADKAQILDALDKLGLKKKDDAKYAILRQNRGRLIKRPTSGPPVIVANGRANWIGWVELRTEPVDEIATRMTARVIQDVNAEVLAVIEAEDRIGLVRFNDQLLKPLAADYRGIMLIDGNDERGIDVGMLVKPGFQIDSIVSHVDDSDAAGDPIFSRDCPEFMIRDLAGNTFLLMINHLKSKGYGSPAASNARRKAQAQRVRQIYDQRRGEGLNLIAIAGDFNDTPASDPLSPLLANQSDLRDIFDHPSFVGDGRPGTYGNGTASGKFDYILLSPDLFSKVTSGGIFRKGVWGGTNGTLFPHYPEMASATHAASDHAAVWAEVTL